MSPSPFDPHYDALPSELPIFPLPGVLLLPGGNLPLNIFEPRYLAMVRDALGGDRLIGMIQPCGKGDDVGAAKIYDTGCLGRITSFNETDDARYLISLTGLIRFTVISELPLVSGYRRVVPEFARYRTDLADDPAVPNRADFLDTLSIYMKGVGIEGDWDAIEDTTTSELVTTLAMICPFDPIEKQALLEARTLRERIETMSTLMTMAVHDHRNGAPSH